VSATITTVSFLGYIAINQTSGKSLDARGFGYEAPIALDWVNINDILRFRITEMFSNAPQRQIR